MTRLDGLRARVIGGCHPSYSNFIYSGTGLHSCVTSGTSTPATTRCGRGVSGVHRTGTDKGSGKMIVGGRRVGRAARRRAGALDGMTINVTIVVILLTLVLFMHGHHGDDRVWLWLVVYG